MPRRSRTPTSRAWTARNSEGYTCPVALAVDVVLITVRDKVLETLLVERDEGAMALPGGFVLPAESAAQAAGRILKEKAGLADIYLEQLAAFTAPSRDTRGWIPSIAYLALVPADTEPRDSRARWTPAREVPSLAWDHEEILAVALDRVEGKLWWSNVAVGILPGEFTLSEARSVYEAIANCTYDPSTFARDLQSTGLIVGMETRRHQTGGRPARLYRFIEAAPAWGEGRRKRVASAA